MKKLAFKLVRILVIIILYIFIINLFASLISTVSQREKVQYQTNNGGMMVKVNIGESVSIQVFRKPHWWGVVRENNGNSYLYLFKTFPLPKKIQNHNFLIFHLIFIVILALFTILIFMKQKVYKGETP